MIQAFVNRILSADADILAAYVTGGLTLIGATITAWLLYRSTMIIARRNLLVETVTKERAAWRQEVRAATLELSRTVLSSIGQASLSSTTAVHQQRLAITLRLNPSRADKHRLDREISDALHALELALERQQQVEARTQLRLVEEKVQKLLKQEWDKSKKEARTGKLER